MAPKHFLNFVTILLSCASPSLAKTLECAVTPSSAGGGYVTETYVFQYDEGSGQALASDGLILYYFDAPLAAKVSDDTAKKLALSWEVKMTNSTGQQTKMMFRASYFKATGAVTIRATPGGGYNNSFEGRGTCRKV